MNVIAGALQLAFFSKNFEFPLFDETMSQFYCRKCQYREQNSVEYIVQKGMGMGFSYFNSHNGFRYFEFFDLRHLRAEISNIGNICCAIHRAPLMTQDYVVTKKGKLSDQDFCRLVSCAAPPGGVCQRP